MAIPSTDIQLANDIYGEANGGYSTGQVSLNDISFYSYFAGLNGSSSISYNAYGRGEGSGANRIYGTSAVTTPVDMDDFKGVTYFYDNSTFQVTLNAVNNLAPQPFPPNPPGSNDANVNVELWGQGFSYQYVAGGGMVTENGGTLGPNALSATNDPIIFRGYWKVTVAGASPMFAGGSCNISINGSAKVTGGAVPPGPGGSMFDYITYGTEDVAAFGGFTGLYFDVTVF